MDDLNGADLLVDTWVMSCRVLSRGMEEFTHNEMINAARSRGCRRIIGKYIPTKKNMMVERHYPRLGYTFMKEEQGAAWWECAIDENTPVPKHFIRRANGN
jgi:predicted enzyme involved in methoxymalonyl-ACP biosynthesis